MGNLFSLSKAITETGLDVSELLLLVCGLVLAVGAAGEYLEDHDRLPSWMIWHRKPKLVFVWMVAISLVGEFIGDAGVFVFSGHLQTIADGEYADLNKEAGQARLDAGKANERAAIAEKASEDERTARLQLQKSVQWRHLSEDQKKGLCAGLSPIMPPTGPTGVTAPLNDIEAANFAREIVIAIAVCRTGEPPARAAPGLPNESPLDAPTFGVWIRVSANPTDTFAARRRDAVRLRHTLERIGIPVEGISDQPWEGIYVGHLPLASVHTTNTQPNNVFAF